MKLENDVIRIERSKSNPLRENITWRPTGDVLEAVKLADEPDFSFDQLSPDAFVYTVFFGNYLYDVPPNLCIRSIYKEHADTLTFSVLHAMMGVYSELTNNGPARVYPANDHSERHTPIEPAEIPAGITLKEHADHPERMIVSREEPQGSFEVIDAAKEPHFNWEDLADDDIIFKAVVLDDDLKVTHTLYCVMLFAEEPADTFERNFLLDDFIDGYLTTKGIGPMFEYEGANPYTKSIFPVNRIL